MIKIEATEQEWQVLTVLIDAAVRANGIRGAGDAINWVMKIEVALKQTSSQDKSNTA